MKKNNKEYYFTARKIIRDLVHGYINLTFFELEIIDSGPFQRLKDIKQLTCQHVYPSATHTRFEHSLGVLELTKRALHSLNENGIIGLKSDTQIITEKLEFNATLAALLHDIGQCPFSHLGENEFDKYDVQKELCNLIEVFLEGDSFDENLKIQLADRNAKDIGAIHELLSCSMILKHYHTMLSQIFVKDKELMVDYELIFRSILGIEYDVSTLKLLEKNKLKNIIVRLLNDKIFDMDKLDYIMRDSFFTGIGTPQIDTQRLFRNMLLKENGQIVFTSRAVPALQNMIDSRDGLYMYVYNHHAVIYSEFIYTYIFRKLDQNVPKTNEEEAYYIEPGIMPKEYFFSPFSVLESQYTDSDIIANLNVQYFYALKRIEESNPPMDENILKALLLIKQLKERKFLKPWWKTVFEMTSFMQRHFPDDDVRGKVGKYICIDGENGLESSEFRAQIAKHFIATTKLLSEKKDNQLLESFADGDFFVVQRSNRFFMPDIIEDIEICLNKNEIIGPPTEVVCTAKEYYLKSLTNIIPQKNYSSIYSKDGFYVYTKKIKNEKYNRIDINKHYETLEKIFVFIVTELIQMGEQKFVDNFQFKRNMSDYHSMSDSDWSEFIKNREIEKTKIKENEKNSIKIISEKFLNI